MHAISSYRGNRPTHTQTNPQTGPITIHCAAKLSAQCNTVGIIYHTVIYNTAVFDVSKPRIQNQERTLSKQAGVVVGPSLEVEKSLIY